MHLLALRSFCAHIGKDPFQIQGQGGNVSYKRGDLMWIKASGTRLENALEREIFAEVTMERHTSSMVRFTPHSLRPSIETIVHCQMEHSYVVHTHDLYVLAFAILQNGREQLEKKLHGISWKWVPYCTPGDALAEEIVRNRWQKESILILENHGLIVASDSLEQILFLRLLVQSRLKTEIPAVPLPFAPRPGYRAPRDEAAHFLAHHPEGDQWISRIFYPDQAIFLNGKFTIRKGEGVELPQEAPVSLDTALAMHARLGMLVQEPLNHLRSLPPEEVNRLQNWDLEKYRIGLNA